MNNFKRIRKISPVAHNKIRECRLRALIGTQEELARMARINRSTLSALENQRRSLSASYALRIAKALNCSLDDLYVK